MSLLLFVAVLAGIAAWLFIEQPVNAFFKQKNMTAAASPLTG
ncbi:hypothetical protein ACQE32_04680 [Pantoea sp. FN0302]